LIVSIGNQNIALCIDACLSGDVTNLALQEKFILIHIIISSGFVVKKIIQVTC